MRMKNKGVSSNNITPRKTASDQDVGSTALKKRALAKNKGVPGNPMVTKTVKNPAPQSKGQAKARPETCVKSLVPYRLDMHSTRENSNAVVML